MPPTTACPGHDVLERFLLGQLPPEEFDSLEGHLSGCPVCLAAMGRLRPLDALLQTLGELSHDPTVQESSMVPDLVQRLERLVQASAPVNPTLTDAPDTASAVTPPPAEGFAFLRPPQGPGEVGRLAHYRVLRRLGAGGMGVVFLAEDTDLDRPVALKVMLPEHGKHPVAAERFLREAKLCASIKNDHIVTIHQVGRDNGVPFLAMELLHGTSLQARLAVEPRLAIAEVARIGREAAQGLAAAHARGLIHRDVKPDNLWLEEPNGRVKILDFGLARPAEGGENLTLSGTVVGTPAYMSPEQANGDKVDARGDLFSLGCVLYRLTTGVAPFQGPSVPATLLAVTTRDPAPVEKLRPETPPALAKLVAALLAKDPARRPADAHTVAAELAAIERSLAAPAAGHTAVIPAVARPPRKEPARKAAAPAAGPKARGRWPWALAAAALLGLAAGGAWYAWQAIRVETPKGTLVIETDDPDVEVVVKQNGAKLFDKTSKREIELKVGDYEIELAEAKDGLHLTTKKFTITKDGKETVRVKLDPAVAVKPPDVNKPESALDKLDPAQIPTEAPFPWQPKELVAVLGDVRGKDLPPGNFSHVTISADGKWIATWDLTQNAARLDDGESLRLRAVLPGGGVAAVAFSPDGKTLAVSKSLAGGGNTCGLYVLGDGEPVPVPKSPSFRDVGTLAFSPDGTRLALGGMPERSVRLWDLTRPGGQPQVLTPPDDWGGLREIPSLLFSADGKTLVTGVDAKGGVHVWDLSGQDPKPRCRVTGGTPENPCHYALAPGGDLLAVLGPYDQAKEWTATLSLWEVGGAAPKLRETAEVKGAPYGLAFTDEGKALEVWQGPGPKRNRWRIEGGLKQAEEHVVPPDSTPVFASNGKRTVVLNSSGSLRLHDASDLHVLADATARRADFLLATPAGDRLVTGGDRIRTWEVTGGVPVARETTVEVPANGPDYWTNWAALAPDGKTAACVGTQGNPSRSLVLRRLDGRDWKVAGELQSAAGGELFAAAWSPDGRTLAALAGTSLVRVWDLTGDKPKAKDLGTVKDGRFLAFSPDSKKLASAGTEGVTMFDLTAAGAAGRLLPREADATPFTAVAFTADGKAVLTSDHLGNLRRVAVDGSDKPGGTVVAELPVYGGFHLSADGRTLVSWGRDRLTEGKDPVGPARLIAWDATTGKKLADWPMAQGVRSAFAAADGKHLFVDVGGVVWVLRLPAGP
jgi:WD40 repeat protein